MVTRLSGGITPADGADPRTFPTIWNATATDIEAAESDIDALEAKNIPAFGTAVPSDGQVLAYSTAISAYEPSAAVGDLDSLSDVEITSVSDGDLLAYDSGTSEWINQALESAQLPVGSVLQVVQATDSTLRTTSSGSFVSAGISASITPQASGNKIICIWSRMAFVRNTGSDDNVSIGTRVRVGGSSVTGMEDARTGVGGESELDHRTLVAGAIFGVYTATSTSSVTFEGEFRVDSGGQAQIFNQTATGIMLLMEVAA